MGRARFTLKGCASYAWRRYIFLKGIPQSVSGQDDIEHLTSLGIFTVKQLEAPTPPPKKKELPPEEKKQEEATPDPAKDEKEEDENPPVHIPKKKVEMKKAAKKKKGKGK